MAGGKRPLIAGNWKMNGLKASASELRRMMQGAEEVADRADLLVCPPATLLAAFADLARDSRLAIGAQDCHPERQGAFTGSLSAEMLADAGACAIIVGHSECRASRGEDDALVRAKAQAAWRAGVMAIVCIGETRVQREAQETLAALGAQLAGSLPDDARVGALVVAYEPVWAIGTGLTPTPGDVGDVHAFIRGHLAARYGAAGRAVRILYGGSVKPSNAAELMGVDDVDGALVGGASLKAADFLAIANACG
jgi:triosephosphate isomerase